MGFVAPLYPSLMVWNLLSFHVSLSVRDGCQLSTTNL